MPSYDYECNACGHSFEAFQSMSDDPLKTCPECNEKSLRRLITGGSGIIFKGSGFYVTDSRKSVGSGNKKTTDDKTASDASAAGASSDSATEKTEPKKDKGDGATKEAVKP
jgi:putative FmdB family regulatory protein